MTKPISKTPVSVVTTILPSNTPYILDSEISSPFASSRYTALCDSLPGGKEKISFFDQPIGNVDGARAALTLFLADFEKRNGGVLEALVLAVDFYSYLVVRNTTVYLIRWQAEHEFQVTPETKELSKPTTVNFSSTRNAARSPVLGTIVLSWRKPSLTLLSISHTVKF